MPVISIGDYEPPKPHLCAGCGLKISDRYYLLAVDRQWHARCLTCKECHVPLDSELTCFARDGNIYCKEDYYRLFAVKRCARCQRGIFANELVMRARDLVYHLHCFTCAWCNTALTQGDYFGLRDNLVYCRAHYELMVHGDNCMASAADSPEGALAPHDHQKPFPGVALMQSNHEIRSPVAATSAYSPLPGAPTGSSGVRKGRPRKRKSSEAGGVIHPHPPGLTMMDAEGCALHLSVMDQNASGLTTGSAPPPPPQRTKRMRTSFKHHQLRTMKSYFSINQNPDAKDLKQLAQKTGLSKRVLQVWFQNARAKWRRNNMKQGTDPSSNGGGQPNQTQQQPSQPPHVSSPGATSSFSESSPVATCGGASTTGSNNNNNPDLHPQSIVAVTPTHHHHHHQQQQQTQHVLPPIDYEPAGSSLTPLPPQARHIASHGSENLPLTSFQELF